MVFKNCKLLGLNLTEANLGNVSFENCLANLCNFPEVRFKQVLFDSTSLQGANFYDCLLNKVAFQESDLNDVDFSQTSLKGIDISTCKFKRLQVTPESLNGCEVSTEQAIGFASLLGLKVKY